mmetsp:Transcript_4999/g.16695  ORF Transcript_4999/g.16695 Transcript_4999/m.16695 type:complete len:227 (-) Transcript_4999:275-955(-)
MFFRVTRTMRASCCGVKAWNSACPLRKNASSSACVGGSSAIGLVSTATGLPPYGPTHSSRSTAPTSSAVGRYSSPCAAPSGTKRSSPRPVRLLRCRNHVASGVPTNSPLALSGVPRSPPTTLRLSTYRIPSSSSSSGGARSCVKTLGWLATGGRCTCLTDCWRASAWSWCGGGAPGADICIGGGGGGGALCPPSETEAAVPAATAAAEVAATGPRASPALSAATLS